MQTIKCHFIFKLWLSQINTVNRPLLTLRTHWSFWSWISIVTTPYTRWISENSHRDFGSVSTFFTTTSAPFHFWTNCFGLTNLLSPYPFYFSAGKCVLASITVTFYIFVKSLLKTYLLSHIVKTNINPATVEHGAMNAFTLIIQSHSGPTSEIFRAVSDTTHTLSFSLRLNLFCVCRMWLSAPAE